MSMTGWGKTVYGLIIDSTDDDTMNYDQVIFRLIKRKNGRIKTRGSKRLVANQIAMESKR